MTAAVSTVPVTIPTGEELVERARAMIPALRERARKATSGAKVPDETIAEMQEAGFFRVLQPRRWGGYEMHPNVFYDIQKLLAEGCMSTGWVYGVLGCHPFELALFPNQAQVDVWGEDDSVLVSSSYQPVGIVERTEGGFYLSGRWGFSSGSQHCQWVLLGALVPPEKEGGAPDMRTFLVPRPDYRIEETWETFGLQGTGSHDIIVERVFVPEHRTHRALDGFLGTNPGTRENNGPLYQIPWAQVFVRAVSTSAIGGCRAAIQAALEIGEKRISTNTGKASKNDPVLVNAIGRAQVELKEIELALRTNFNDIYGYVERGEALPMELRVRNRYQSSSVARRCAELVDNILPLLGGRAIYMSSSIVQPWLDLHAARAHVANDPGQMSPDVVGNMRNEPPVFNFL